jgi:CO/xanthine dehydrogenase Mo-binding subunit
MSSFAYIGRSRPLNDGAEKVSGQTKFAPDIQLPGLLHARFVTSPYAHARITGLDTDDALAVPGVTAVFTAADLPDIIPKTRNKLLLARERVIFAGQPVALVLADSKAAAQDGVERVWVEYDPLPAAVTIDAALAPDAPLVWPGGAPGETGEAAAHGADVADGDEDDKPGNQSRHSHWQRGDVAAALAEADLVVERTFTTPMVHQSYLETQSVVALPDPLGQGFTVYTSTQAPFYIREEVAAILGLEETAVRVIPTKPGGAFGGKFLLYELLIALVAQRLGRPVSLSLTRGEELLAGNPAPAARIRVKLAAQADGTLTALQADLTYDVGCYPNPHAIGAIMLGSYYQIPNLDVTYIEVMTHKVSTAAYRAPATPQATFALESVVDEIAHRLDLDPFELRLRHASQTGDKMLHDREWGHMGLRPVLEAIRRHPLWQNREEVRQRGRGVGLAVGGWPGGVEPAAAICQLHRDGTLQVQVGSVDLSGTATGFSLLAAEAFGLEPEQVRVAVGDTTTAAYAGATGGSKITYTVGPAVIEAAQQARQQTLAIMAEEWEVDTADLEIVAGEVRVKGVPDKSISLGDIAKKTMRFGGKYAPVLGNGRHANTTGSPGFCAQLAEVEVDRETGEVVVHRLVLAQDVGRAINPLILEGQMAGGAVQGLGWALYEQMVHDENGQLLSGSWMDYTVPHFDQSPPLIEKILVENPTDLGPYGARGVGEPPVIATAAAVGNAIADATNARLTDLPMTAPRVLVSIHKVA